MVRENKTFDIDSDRLSLSLNFVPNEYFVTKSLFRFE